jgi:hypothetical protein
MRVCGEKRHLTLRIAPIGAMGVGLDEFPYSEAIRGFFRRDRNMFAHDLVSLVWVVLYAFGQKPPGNATIVFSTLNSGRGFSCLL